MPDFVNDFLEQVIQKQTTHAKWLNSLSYLEYRGARKIMRALSTEDVEDEILMHTMEEVRHALFFKRLAIKVGGKTFRHYSNETMLASGAIKSYFYELDMEANIIVAQSGSKLDVYRLVTWLIEERALNIYDRYEVILQRAGFKITLKPILADEARHLAEMKSQLCDVLTSRGVKIESLLALEDRLFKQTLSALREALQQNLDPELQAL